MIGRITIEVNTDEWDDFDESKHTKADIQAMIIDELAEHLRDGVRDVEGYTEFEEGPFSRYTNISEDTIIINVDAKYNKENDIEGEPKGIAGALGATLKAVLDVTLERTSYKITNDNGINKRGTIELIKNTSTYDNEDLQNIIDEAYFEVLQNIVGDQK